MTAGHVRAQATVRTDGRETVTIKLIGYRPEEIDEMLTDLPDAAIHPIGVARLEARRR